MCAQRGRAGDAEVRAEANEDGRQCVDDVAGKPRARALREMEKKERAYCGPVPAGDKADESSARKASGTGTVEWRSASVGTPTPAKNPSSGRLCSPGPRLTRHGARSQRTAHRSFRSVRRGPRLLPPSRFVHSLWSKHTALDHPRVRAPSQAPAWRWVQSGRPDIR